MLRSHFHIGAPVYCGSNSLLRRRHLRNEGTCTERGILLNVACMSVLYLARLVHPIVREG